MKLNKFLKLIAVEHFEDLNSLYIKECKSKNIAYRDKTGKLTE
jgi:hypothetical protein